MKRFVIDLALCIGCDACKIACRDRADLPDGLDWLRVETYESGVYPNPSLEYRVVHCLHCAEAPCIPACPEGAIARDAQGLVHIDAMSCTGCGDCVQVCPFHAVVMQPGGAASKCDGCADEVARGWEPTCVRACPMRALGYREDLPDVPRIAEDDWEQHPAGPRVAYLRRA